MAIGKEIVRNRCCGANRRKRANIPQPLLYICPKLAYASDNVLIDSLEFSLDGRSSTVLPENRYGKFFKLSRAKLTKHCRTVLLLKECGFRYDSRRLGTLGIAYSSEHLRPEQSLRVVQFLPTLVGAGLWVDEIADAFDTAGEDTVGKRRHADRDRFANSNKSN